MPELVTYVEYQKLSPREQGFAAYVQGELPGSELRDHQANPYPVGSFNAAEWRKGEFQGILAAQDSEE